jgi:hypothetical protein
MPVSLLLVIGAGVAGAFARPPETAASAAAAVAQMLRDLPPPVKPPAPSMTSAPAPKPPAPVPALSANDLTEAADLCVDLSRVLSSEDVPALLGRASNVLGATGLVVWVADERGDSLVPALWHGYSERVVAKMGPLDAGGDNITSVCFRTGRPQSMPGVGQPGATSAIAIPLVTAAGCHGVMAAELTAARPPVEGVALARIIAAQLAAMVAPSDESSGGAVAAV